jgi:hypothetical protein
VRKHILWSLELEDRNKIKKLRYRISRTNLRRERNKMDHILIEVQLLIKINYNRKNVKTNTITIIENTINKWIQDVVI